MPTVDPTLTSINSGASVPKKFTVFNRINIMDDRYSENRNGSLFVLPVVPFPKAAFTPDRFGGSGAAAEECAFLKLKINTGACIQGIRINMAHGQNYETQLDNLDEIDIDIKRLSYIKIYKVSHRWNQPEEVIQEIGPENVLTDVNDGDTLFAKYRKFQNPTVTDDYLECISNRFTVWVFDHLGEGQDYSTLFDKRSVLIIDESNVDEPDKERNERIKCLCATSDSHPVVKPTYLLVTTDIKLEVDYSIINIFHTKKKPPITLPASTHYNGVIDGGWFVKDVATNYWFPKTHRIPFDLSTDVRSVEPTGNFWVLSCYDKNRNYYHNKITLLPKGVMSLEGVKPMVSSMFMTDTVNTDALENPTLGSCYLVDLNYGRNGRLGSTPPLRYKQSLTISIGNEKGLEIESQLNDTIIQANYTTPCGISWYGSARHFVNCTPMTFESHDKFNLYQGMSDKFAPQFIFTIGHGTHADSQFLGCMNMKPIRCHNDPSQDEE
jgi:hypothetical protein